MCDIHMQQQQQQQLSPTTLMTSLSAATASARVAAAARERERRATQSACKPPLPCTASCVLGYARGLYEAVKPCVSAAVTACLS
eukprot:jgi/Chlat1/5280/Chrsp35S05235